MARIRCTTPRMLLLVIIALCSLTGCTTTHYRDPRDPFEGINRAVFTFNRGFDKILYRPVAVVYNTVVPPPIVRGISNAFDNVALITSVLNDILQFNFKFALHDTGRLLINSTVGVAGLFDVAKHFGLPYHRQDFGLTLAKWGATRTPYIMIPFLGPSTTRDFIGVTGDFYYLSIWPFVRRDPRFNLTVLRVVEQRARFLQADRLIDEAFDPYIFVRNAYLQRRNFLIRQVKSGKRDLHGDIEDNNGDDYSNDNNQTANKKVATHTKKTVSSKNPKNV